VGPPLRATPTQRPEWRFGRNYRQSLLEAIGNARRDGCLARGPPAPRQERRCREKREAAQREARRPVCKDCGQKFTDERWEAVGYTRNWSKRQSRPHLCEDCRDPAVAVEQQAEVDERERQEQERRRQEQDAEQAAQKAGGRLPRFRT
jgi:hypothetical protein